MTVVDRLELVGQYTQFAAAALAHALRAWQRPLELARQFYQVLIGALPLGLIAGLSLGVVVWMHLRDVVPREHRGRVPEYLAYAVVLEFAPLGAALIVAGRSGASLGAELGSMRLTEQIDALEAMGLAPMKHLVGPRVLAAMLALPLLTLYVAFIAIGSSFAMEMVGGSLSWTQYQQDIMRGLAQAKALPATAKTVVFGFLVACTGCFCGMRASEGTEGVGKAATRGVVGSILLVLLANVLLVKIIQVLFG